MSANEAALGRLQELVVVLSEDMEQGLAALGLTRSRAHVLWELHRCGPVTQRTLSDALRVTPRNVTGLVDALVDGGFVSREPHPTDRRATLITLTGSGAETAAAMAAGQRDLADQLFGSLPPGGVEEFTATLDHLLAQIRSQQGAGGAQR
ncbi:MarR family transcriptional regulator [Saccharopolyspora erythraea]|nr:MarR family transcriptional regulator [Saccharopolyspora erythraea]